MNSISSKKRVACDSQTMLFSAGKPLKKNPKKSKKKKRNRGATPMASRPSPPCAILSAHRFRTGNSEWVIRYSILRSTEYNMEWIP